MTGTRAITRLMAAISLTTVAASSPQVNFPLSSQYPAVARTGQFYSFQFAPTTFEPDSDKLQYSLIGNPSWLSLNGKNRTLLGTPGAEDAGIAVFTIAAARYAGEVAYMQSKLLVVYHDTPKTNGNITQQLSGSGQLSGPKTLTFLPCTPFEVKFSSELFQTRGESLSYYATLTDHNPLPAWISFDAPSLRFAGTTPSLASVPQSYELLLIASDTPGYAAASISFALTISNHQLLFKPLHQTISFMKGDHVSVTNLRSKVTLDSTPITDGDILSATAEIPTWLSFNNETLDITGTPPSGLRSQDITVSVRDKFGDVAKHSIQLLFRSRLLTGEIEQLNITTGENFEYTIPQSHLSKSGEILTMDFGPLSEWLHFNPTTLIIDGKLPEDFAPQDFHSTLTATYFEDKITDSQVFEIHVSGTGTHVYNESTTFVAHPMHPTDSNNAFVARGYHKSKRDGIIIGAVIASIFVAAILLACAGIFCRRRRPAKEYTSPRSPWSPRKTDISCPAMHEDECEDVDKTTDGDLENGDGGYSLPDRTQERPPRLDLDLTVKKKSSHKSIESIDEGETQVRTTLADSDWTFKDEAGPSHRPHDSMEIPTEMARQDSDRPSPPPKNERRTTTAYRDLHPSLTSLRNGRHTHIPSRSNNNFTRRHSWSSYSNTTRCTSLTSTAPSTVPQPHTARHTTQLTNPMEKRHTTLGIRLVQAPTCESLVDLPFHEKRHSFIRNRASGQYPAPFFGASSSRISSSSYRSSPGLSNDIEDYSRDAHSPLPSSNIAVKQDEDVVKKPKRVLPDVLRIREPSETPTVESSSTAAFAGSLRKSSKDGSSTHRHTTAALSNHDRVEKHYEAPGTAAYTGYPTIRKPSSRYSLRSQELKSKLNNLVGSQIFDDAEPSESEYSQEQDVTEGYGNGTTVKPHQFQLSPLNIPGPRKAKRDSKRDSDKDSKRSNKWESYRQLKRTIERDATPFPLAIEQGEKEDHSSTYSLVPEPVSSKAKGKAKVTEVFPERPKRSTDHRHTFPAYAQHSRTEPRATNHPSTHRHSQPLPLSHRLSYQSQHGRSQSEQSAPASKSIHTRDRSQAQYSAYPFFDSAPIPPSTKGEKERSQEATESYLPRDVPGSIIDYALHEDATLEELASGSVEFRTSNGRIRSSARASRLAQLTASDNQSSHGRFPERETIVQPKSLLYTQSNARSIGLGLNPLGGSLDLVQGRPAPEDEERTREWMIPSMLDYGNGGDSRLRTTERKGRRPVSVAASEDVEAGGQQRRRTWGSLKAVMGGGKEKGVQRERENERERERERWREGKMGRIFFRG
ncbi:hypothetical protein K504DRAFT_501910 [Pleomassaria siparia CBS 279.74]|uniref:Dystroglycan-type cadherin-like domain-containing protein n=1 Tax=Pleomassaria siparia CBS 279.74 TaxID=1314801 RepID=A0A6G1K9E6_9PLEO|nr:hypothetical protein K504DRAFT_501910 [Pleomassaria siparia CBS 279.74]